MDTLNKLYDEKLIDSLFLCVDYPVLIKFDEVSKKLFTTDLALKVLDRIKEDCSSEDYDISSEDRRSNLLSLLNDIRFNYQYKDEKQKDTVYNDINYCMCKINSASIDNVCFIYDENNKPIYFDVYLEEQLHSFDFMIMYYYLQDKSIFENKGINYLICNLDKYISSLYSIITDYPEVLQEQEFLLRTMQMTMNTMSCIRENPDMFSSSAKKEVKKLYKAFK